MDLFSILLIAPGESIHSQRYANWILENGGNVFFLDATNPFPEGKPGFHFIPYPYRGDRKLRQWIGSKWGGKLSAWLNVPLLWLIWRKVKPDIVHVHYVDHRAYQSLMAGHRPLVLSVWGSDVNYQFLPDTDTELRKIVGASLLKADQVLVDTPDMILRCRELAGSEIEVDLLTFGVDCRLFFSGYYDEVKALRTSLGIDKDAFVFLSIRGWNKYYNHDLILEAFHRAYLNFDRPVYLIFKRYATHVEAPILQNQIIERANQLNLAHAVLMIDEIPHSKMPVLYNFADAIINYPHVDAFPVTFIEAAACECKVISCLLPAYKNSFAEQYFRMIPSDDIDLLSQSMLAEVNDRIDRQLALTQARQFVIDHYDESISIQKMLKAYKQVIEKWRH